MPIPIHIKNEGVCVFVRKILLQRGCPFHLAGLRLANYMVEPGKAANTKVSILSIHSSLTLFNSMPDANSMRYTSILILLLVSFRCMSQSIDTSRYRISVELSEEANRYFKNDGIWCGADGASSIDLGNNRILWLFSDGFICSDSTRSRKKSKMIRNSVAIQRGYDLKTSSITYYWDKSGKEAKPFFTLPGNYWAWTGHGVMLNDKLIIFLIKEHAIKDKLGFEACGWYMVLVSNPEDEPSEWKMKYVKGAETFGVIAGAAVLKDSNYVYSFGAVEPDTHEGYLLRWKSEAVLAGDISKPEWCIDGKWIFRKSKDPVPKPLFTGGTEFSVHYDSLLRKYIQVQSFGFGEGTIELRMADSINGQWTKPLSFYKPEYPGVKKPFMYSAKSHPELKADGMYITYNVNSFDFGELIENQDIYFPKFILIKITENKPR